MDTSNTKNTNPTLTTTPAPALIKKSHHKKKPTTPAPNPNENANPAPSDLENSVNAEIEAAPAPAKKSIFKELIDAAQTVPTETPTEKQKALKNAEKDSGLAADLPTILSSVITLVFSALGTAPEIRPNNEEIGGLSYYGSRLLLRHIDLNSALTADTLDIIGILSISAGWYMRINPNLIPVTNEFKALDERTPAKKKPGQPEPKQPTDGGGQINDSAASNFLDHVVKKAKE